MMKFTIGLAIIAFTLIVGGYKYAENADLISLKERGLHQAQSRMQEANALLNRLDTIKERSLPTGTDQKFAIERQLNIGDQALRFNFIGLSNNENGDPLYHHTFRINGAASFAEVMRILNAMATQPGFSVYNVCFACEQPKEPLQPGQYMVTIEGYLYVYDPNSVI